ncbi:MFS transporter [Ammoniphilus sp. YIM 78166]|uniref:MFS transporter n=1 Tax=Ammoniphilus sp. YIM 78166 TaxID=1644106 RepID=UPI00106F2492|nr:MFS transporter [Ammoniphilus sp. YIM 78166]
MEYINVNFRLFYFTIYFSFGILSTLISVYFHSELHLNGTQIGMILSLTPVIVIFSQPLWGIASDTVPKPKLLLFIVLICTALMSIFLSKTSTFLFLIIVHILFSFFQSAVVPLSDSTTLNYTQKEVSDYGSIRLYGAIGFALAVFIGGKASELFGLKIIFYIYSLMFLIAAYLSVYLPAPKSPKRNDLRIKDGFLLLLKQKPFILFLAVVFCIFGPINANNTYFGLFIVSLGGSLTSIGIAFLLSTGLEAPMMKVAQRFVKRLGMEKVIILAAAASTLRWFIYFFQLPIYVVYASAILQGLSVGLFIPTALQYVSKLTERFSIQSTAISIYQAIGLGVGVWFSTVVGGVIFEYLSIFYVYAFFMILNMSGIIFMYMLIKSLRSEVRSDPSVSMINLIRYKLLFC